MPGLHRYLKDEESKTQQPTRPAVHPEHHDLWVPSKITEEYRDRVCIPGLLRIEQKLREAQCGSSLEKLRHVLRIKSWLAKFKAQNLRGQREGTRSRAIIERVQGRAKLAAARYRHARGILLKLVGPGVWEQELQPLLDEDVRSYDDIKKPKKTEPRKGT
ncbi:hypothetical protein BJ165DRAFT_1331574, partial [Panaeolus papilionaceus]